MERARAAGIDAAQNPTPEDAQMPATRPACFYASDAPKAVAVVWPSYPLNAQNV